MYEVSCPRDERNIYINSVNEFLLRIVGNFGVSKLEKIQHFVTFLNITKYISTQTFMQNVEQYHPGFKLDELETAEIHY